MIGSLCTGIRGLDLAVQAMWGGEVAWHAEIDPSCSAWLERNSPGVPNLGDIKQVEWSTVPRVDVLTAGFPCQPFSHAGRRKGEDDERHLWPAVAEAIRVLRPERVVLENVPGLRSLGLGRVLADLASMGYVGRWGSVRASDAGAPHQRDRLFIVARDSDCAGLEGHGSERELAEGRGQIQAVRPGDVATNAWGMAGAPTGEREGGPRAGSVSPARGDQGEAFSGAARRDSDDGLARWGQYADAISRWELILGRPAPTPVDADSGVSAHFAEWMMGYPEGWVDGMSRREALKALGNAVCPQQAHLALQLITMIGDTSPREDMP